MRKVRTHFEQVPLEIVCTVIEEQIWREAKIEQEQRLREKMIAKKGVAVAKQSKAEPDKSSQAYASKEVYEAQQ